MRKGQKVKKLSLDSIDKDIISELIKDANIGTSHLSRKFKVPLSTIQRRKRTLENSILNKKYEINHNELGWRAGDLIILVEKGKTTEAMEHILKNHGDNSVISVTADLIQAIVPTRLSSSKKGDNCIVLVIGGSGIYHGAPLLSTLAALRSGVDLVYTAVPKSNIVLTRSFSPNVIVLPLSTDDFDVRSAKYTLRILPKKPDVVAIGMGMKLATPESLK